MLDKILLVVSTNRIILLELADRPSPQAISLFPAILPTLYHDKPFSKAHIHPTSYCDEEFTVQPPLKLCAPAANRLFRSLMYATPTCRLDFLILPLTHPM